jgi:hypothetical protein
MKRQKWIIQGFDISMFYFTGKTLSGNYCWSLLENRAIKFSKKEMLEMNESLSEIPEFKKFNARFVEV